MSFLNFKADDLVYIENMGYGKLVDCGLFESLSLKNVSLSMKKSSIIFDPDMFNANQNFSNSNQSPEVQVQQNVLQPQENINKKAGESEEINQKNEERICREVEEQQKRQQTVNIVTVALQGTNALIHTPDSNIRKYVLVPVKVMLPNFRETLIVQIQLKKTLQSLKKVIFDQLGINPFYYYNFRFFSTSPSFCEFSVLTKTIYDCKLSQTSNIVMVAQHGFCFEAVPKQFTEHYFLSNNNFVLTGFKQTKAQNLQSIKQEAQHEEDEGVKQEGKTDAKNNSYLEVGCDTLFSSGKHYWEIKINKYDGKKEEFVVGVKEEKGTISWVFYPLISKLQIRKADSKAIMLKTTDDCFKKGDTIGLYLQFSGKKGRLTIYKNNANVDLGFEQIGEGVRPFVGIGEDCEITLDSKVLPPLDIHRHK